MSAARHGGRNRGRGGFRAAEVSAEGNTAKRGNRKVRFNTDPIEMALAASKATNKGQSPAVVQSGKRLNALTAKPLINGVQGRTTSASVKRDVLSYQERYQKLKGLREHNRTQAIKDGVLADPDKPRTLAEAITPVGTCQDMCPEFERVERIVQKDVWAAEVEPESLNDAYSEQVASETRMVKKFRRAAAGLEPQLPSDLRPPSTLQRTVDYLFDDIIGKAQSLASIHHFVWDRTRAIRNDFSIQQLSKTSDLRIAIECYEKIARFHILSLHQLALKKKPYEKYDWYQEREQLDRTLLSLMQYYDDSREQLQSPNEAEFRAYCIIFQIQSPIPDMEDRVQTWPRQILLNMRVQKALELYAAACNVADAQGPLKPRAPHAIAQANWEKFWTLIRSNQTSYLMSCVAEIYFNLVRRTALMAIWKASRQVGKMKVDGWTISKLTRVLGFDKVRQVEEFCAQYGFSFDRRDDGKRFLDVNSVRGRNFPEPSSGLKEQVKSEKIVEVKRHGRTLPAVIKGLSVAAAQAAGLIEKKGLTNGAQRIQADGSSSITKQHAKKIQAKSGNAEDDMADSDTLFVGQDPSERKNSSPKTFHFPTNGVEANTAKAMHIQQSTNGTDYTLKGKTYAASQSTNSIFSFKNVPPGDTSTTSFGKPSAPAINVDAFPSKAPFSSPFASNSPKPKESSPISNNPQPLPNLYGPNTGFSFKTSGTQSLSSVTASPTTTFSASNIGPKAESTPAKFEFKSSQSPGKAFIFSGSDPKANEAPAKPKNFPPLEQSEEKKPKELFSNDAQKSNESGENLDPIKTVQNDTTPSKTLDFLKPAEASTAQTLAQSSVLGNSSMNANKELKPVAIESKPLAQQGQRNAYQNNHVNTTNHGKNSNQHGYSKPPTSIFDTERKAFDNLAKHMVLHAETGFLAQFIEYTIGPVISESMKQVAQERLQRQAMQFRHDWLAARYGRAWKEVVWHLKLARQGRKRRARIAQKREEKAQLAEGKVERDVRDFEELVGAARGLDERSDVDARWRSNGKKKTRGREGIGKSRRSRRNASEDRKQVNMEREIAEMQNRERASDRQMGVTTEAEEKQQQQQQQQQQQNQHFLQNSFYTSTPTPTPASTFNSSLTDGPERRSTTKTNYFRLKALGIQPVGQNIWDRPLTAKTTTPTKSPITSKMRMRMSPPPSLPPPPPSSSSLPPPSLPSSPSSPSSSSLSLYSSRRPKTSDTMAQTGKNKMERKPSQAQTLTQTQKHTQKQKQDEPKQEDKARQQDANEPSSRGVKRRKSYTSDAEQQDEALFARLRAAKEALQESISFFREEMALCDGDGRRGDGGLQGQWQWQL